MTCGSCQFTDGMCYTSYPPKVKCTITNEFHLYGDECTCETVRASKVDELAQLKMMLNQPLLTIDYNDLTVSSAAVSNEDLTDFNMAEAEVGCTACLVCGESIGLKIMDGGPKICKTCKKAIQFIRNNIDSLDSIVACYEHGLEEQTTTDQENCHRTVEGDVC